MMMHRTRVINFSALSLIMTLGLMGCQQNVTTVPGNTVASESQSLPAEEQTTNSHSIETSGDKPWHNFKKPSKEELKKKLDSLQYNVTQEEGTESSFQNKYWDNKKAGIYVDIVSGEPLFTSTDKYKSGTGWPSFVKPIDPQFIELKVDRGLWYNRTEVRSKYGDSHLGHVFDDGPADRGGKRYCMNSAAMRFIPKEEMEAQGYGEYLPLVEETKE
ncbi:MAG TPA: peptide-methionine (R)-S-oxide reductase [Planctomycetaceae bacterium]|nr:peptide-methionine (R)-S-oxide reductase [Planctomycetaceae bacterium]